MKIIPYQPKYKAEFIEMNLQWIKDMFVLEAEDLRIFSTLDTQLEQGGQIFFALEDVSEEVMACCMITPLSNDEWEIAKFAAKVQYKGRGAGAAVLQACIDYAKQKQIKKLVIVTNSKCQAAIHLYRKAGFTEVPVDKEKFPFERANVAFEMPLEKAILSSL